MNLLVLIPIAALFSLGLFVGRHELVKRRLACPHKHKSAQVDVQCPYSHPEQLVGVRRCDLLEDPTRVDCDQACLRASLGRS